MNIFDRIVPVAFLACVGLTACNEANHDSYPTDRPAGPVDTVMQPNLMPAPAPAAPEGVTATDSAATKPLANLDAKKESTGMPEALHGNNHSSPAVGSSGPETSKNGANDPSSPLKKSSLIAPKSPKVIWV